MERHKVRENTGKPTARAATSHGWMTLAVRPRPSNGPGALRRRVASQGTFASLLVLAAPPQSGKIETGFVVEWQFLRVSANLCSDVGSELGDWSNGPRMVLGVGVLSPCDPAALGSQAHQGALGSPLSRLRSAIAGNPSSVSSTTDVIACTISSLKKMINLPRSRKATDRMEGRGSLGV